MSTPHHHQAEKPQSPAVTNFLRQRWAAWSSYFTVQALNSLNATRTMADYLAYVSNLAAAPDIGTMQPMSRLGLERVPDEHIVSGMPGYRGLGPVRCGNAAWTQVQNDGYGAVILAATPCFFDERLPDMGGENGPGPLLLREEGLIADAPTDLSGRDLAQYYPGMANSVLWPWCHYCLGLTDFNRATPPCAAFTPRSTGGCWSWAWTGWTIPRACRSGWPPIAAFWRPSRAGGAASPICK